MTDIFLKASKEKLRFETTKGHFSTEDLWDLSLESLDSITKAINKKLKEETEESFISTKSSSNTTLQLKLDILKEIIKIKLEAKDRAKARADKQAKLAQLEELAGNKANEALSGKSLEEIQAMIAELKADA